MTISNELKEIYASAPTDKRYVETLELTHSQFSKRWLICNELISWDFVDENGAPLTFQPLPFGVKLPNQDNGGSQELVISIANTGLEMMDELEAAQTIPTENIQCIYRIYKDTVNTAPQIDPPIRLSISDVTADIETISATASRFDILGRAFPTVIYHPEDFPGLVR